jgi:hypothetical protein
MGKKSGSWRRVVQDQASSCPIVGDPWHDTYHEALAIIEQNKPVVLALARASIDHPQRTLNGTEIDEVIARAIAVLAAEAERKRRADWARICASAATFRPDGDFPRTF